jgi:transcription elongation factor Elf1
MGGARNGGGDLSCSDLGYLPQMKKKPKPVIMPVVDADTSTYRCPQCKVVGSRIVCTDRTFRIGLQRCRGCGHIASLEEFDRVT